MSFRTLLQYVRHRISSCASHGAESKATGHADHGTAICTLIGNENNWMRVDVASLDAGRQAIGLLTIG